MSDARYTDRKQAMAIFGPSPMRGGGGHGGPGGKLGMPAERARDAKGTLRKLARRLRPFWLPTLATFIAAALSTLFAVLAPAWMGRITTLIFRGAQAAAAGSGGIDFSAIGRLLVWLVAFYLISSLFTYLQQYLITGVSQHLIFNLRAEAQNKLDRLPLSYFDGRSHGEILSRVTNDVDTISATLQQSLTQLISSVVSILGVFVMMLAISPLLTMIAVLSLPLAMLTTRLIAKNSRGFFSAQQKALGELSGHVEEAFSGHVVVKAFGREAASVASFSAVNDRLYEAGWKAQFISGLVMPIMQFINNSGYVAVSVAGGILALRRLLEIGDIQAFLQYLRNFTMPIVQLAQITNIIQSTIAAAERVFNLLEESEELADPAEPLSIADPRGQVEFRGVGFRYRQDTPLIENLDLCVQSGSLIAIVGPTGAGKTTLVNLLMRFYEVNAGAISVDGVDIRRMSRKGLRSLLGMVLQDTWLFNGTILDNIAWGAQSATREQVIEAARLAQADHFIRTLPEGYETVLNEEASNLSQGQKQLITIARALLADPAVLILDEATSSVDTRTEMLIQQGLRALMADRTSFVIAHRLSTIRDADHILVMEQGAIVEQGRHEDLLAKNGPYSELYRSQFAGNVGLVQ